MSDANQVQGRLERTYAVSQICRDIYGHLHFHSWLSMAIIVAVIKSLAIGMTYVEMCIESNRLFSFRTTQRNINYSSTSWSELKEQCFGAEFRKELDF